MDDDIRSKRGEFLGDIKSAEMELDEACWKLCDGDKSTAMQCLQQAFRDLEHAAQILNEA